MKIGLASSRSLGSIRNVGSPRGRHGSTSARSSIRASGGGLSVSSSRNRSRECGLALHLDQDAAGLILDEAVETEPRRETVDEGAKADALDDAADRDGTTIHRCASRTRCP